MDNWKMNLWNLVVGKTYYRNQARFESKYKTVYITIKTDKTKLRVGIYERHEPGYAYST